MLGGRRRRRRRWRGRGAFQRARGLGAEAPLPALRRHLLCGIVLVLQQQLRCSGRLARVRRRGVGLRRFLDHGRAAFAVDQPDVVDRVLHRGEGRRGGEHPAGKHRLRLLVGLHFLDFEEGGGLGRVDGRGLAAGPEGDQQAAEAGGLADIDLDRRHPRRDLVQPLQRGAATIGHLGGQRPRRRPGHHHRRRRQHRPDHPCPPSATLSSISAPPGGVQRLRAGPGP